MVKAEHGGESFPDKMRYCWHCRRINPGEPLYCQFCGSTFSVRVCGRCRRTNPKEALLCRYCGSCELSDTAGPMPLWLKIWGITVSVFLFTLKAFVCLFAFALAVAPLPEMMKKITTPLANGLKQKMFSTKERG